MTSQASFSAEPQVGPRQRWLVPAALAACAAVLVVNAVPTFGSVVDDAYIAARYAAQLNAGHGLVYNAGEWIEGYTSHAWVLLIALGLQSGAAIEWFLPGLGLACGLLGLYACWAFARALGADTRFALLAVAALALDPHLAVASTIGLEAPLWMAALLGSAALVLRVPERARWAVGLALGSLPLIRPEGYLALPCLCALDLVAHRKTPWRLRLGLWVSALLPALALLVFRVVTYGGLLPNTFHAKAKRSVVVQVLRNLDFYGVEWPYFAILMALTLWSVLRLRRTPAVLVVAALALGLVAGSLRVHEWMPGARLLLPVIAFGYCLLAAACSQLAEPARLIAWKWLPIALIPLALGPLPALVRAPDGRDSVPPHSPAQEAAQRLGRQLRPGATLATRDAGLLAYFVGPEVRVAELHERALTQLHPGGANARPYDYTPRNPELVILTVTSRTAQAVKFAPERQVFEGLSVPYDYLGRVQLVINRYYDVYVRGDLRIPALPRELVANRLGPTRAR